MIVVEELYLALKAAGVDDTMARAAARAVLGAEARAELVTKADLAALETTLIKWNVGALLALSAIVSAIVKLT